MRYHQHKNYRQHKRSMRRRKIIFALIVLITLGVCIYFAIENYKAENTNTDESTTSATTTSYIAPSIQVFRSPYFQFQTSRNWTEDPGSSSGNKYTYRSMRGNLLEHTLAIYVNSAPEDLKATRVLEATLNGNRGLKSEKVSEHCGKSINYKDSSFVTTIDKITFQCFGDDTRYTVFVGLINGGVNMKLARPDGSPATYTIYYSNVTATPDPSQLMEIINTFQTR